MSKSKVDELREKLEGALCTANEAYADDVKEGHTVSASMDEAECRAWRTAIELLDASGLAEYVRELETENTALKEDLESRDEREDEMESDMRETRRQTTHQADRRERELQDEARRTQEELEHTQADLRRAERGW